MEVYCEIDTTNLSAAIDRLLNGFTKRTPAIAANTAALFVIRGTQEKTPVTTIGRIDTEMNVITSPKVLKNGKLSKDKTKQNEVVNLMAGGDGELNAAMSIVIARTHPTSNYNVLTGNRWALQAPSFNAGKFTKAYGESGKAMAAQLWWQWVRDAATRMVKARHSSVAFLKASWTESIARLIPNVPSRFRGDVSGFSQGRRVLMSSPAVPAREGETNAVCRVSNTLGVDNANSVLGDKYNEAAHRILEPVLQNQIDNEAWSTMQRVHALELESERAMLAKYGLILS